MSNLSTIEYYKNSEKEAVSFLEYYVNIRDSRQNEDDYKDIINEVYNKFLDKKRATEIFKGIHKYWKNPEKKEIENIVKSNQDNFQNIVKLLIADTKINYQYIYSHIILEIKDEFEKLIGEDRFDDMETMISVKKGFDDGLIGFVKLG